MNNIVELSNYEKAGYCTLSKEMGEKTYFQTRKFKGFTGLYFEDTTHFFAIHPTQSGPMLYFKGKEYPINENLNISWKKNLKRRTFRILDYGIEINYAQPRFLGMTEWSSDFDDDLFFMIEQEYKKNIVL